MGEFWNSALPRAFSAQPKSGVVGHLRPVLDYLRQHLKHH